MQADRQTDKQTYKQSRQTRWYNASLLGRSNDEKNEQKLGNRGSTVKEPLEQCDAGDSGEDNGSVQADSQLT